MAITEQQAKAAKWTGKDHLLGGGDGLFLNIRRSSKTWLIRRTVQGKTTVRTIGKYPTMSAKAARAFALAESLKRNPSNITLGELAEDYYTAIASEHRRPEQIRGYLDRAILPELGTRRVIDIAAIDVASVIKRYRDRGTRAADQLRSVFSALFRYGVEVGVRPDNPAAALTRRVSGYRPVSRDRVLDDDELRLVWRTHHDNGRLLRFLILTGLRITEARLGERQGDRWLVSSDLSKNGKEHWVYLTPTAMAQLPLSPVGPTAVQSWLRRWCAREGIRSFTPHDCRRTTATRMADAGVDPFVIERVLNHTLHGVMAVYNRGEYEAERISAAQALERQILEVIA